MTATPPVLDWAVIIGDALHNERSALDYLAYELVRLDGGTPNTNTAFPILETQNAGRLNQATQGMDPNHRTTIEAEQPYNGIYGAASDDPLLMLRDLSNFDKHRTVHLCYVNATPVNVSVTPPGALQLEWTNTGPLEDGSVVRRFRNLVAVATDIEVESGVVLEIAFAQGGPCAGLPVVQTLGAIGVRVAEIVQRFRQYFP